MAATVLAAASVAGVVGSEPGLHARNSSSDLKNGLILKSAAVAQKMRKRTYMLQLAKRSENYSSSPLWDAVGS